MLSHKERGREHIRLTANWDPTFPNEKTDWYDEYIQRNAPIATNWFELPHTRDDPTRLPVDVRGMSLYHPNKHEVLAVSPLDDGSVCIWDVKGSRGKQGSIVARSLSGLLCADGPATDLSRRSKRIDSGVVECVSIDNQRDRAFFAVQNRQFPESPFRYEDVLLTLLLDLVEVDLTTMAVVRDQTYEWSINTLSTIQPTIPLTVGTTLGLHLHDHRSPSHSLPLYAPLAQPSPLSILHLERAGYQDQISDDIFVAGRFSNILHYDRRMFPSIQGSIHSGAKLCAMTSLPYPFSCMDSELRREFQLSEEQVKRAKSESGRTLIACGEYNTKGSLEMYGLSANSYEAKSPDFRKSTMKNRQTASRSKLLSVVNHGTRIVYSDGQGYVNWVERDGFTEVRRYRIGLSEIAHRSLFGSMPGSDEIALKILSTKFGHHEDDSVNNDDILLWTGERLGLLSFSSKPGFFADDFEDEIRTPEDIAAEKEQQLYGEKMRQALERHARDVHFVRNLGAGSIRTGA